MTTSSLSAFSDELWQALRGWHAPSPEDHPWQRLALFVPGASLRSSLNRVLLIGLEALDREDAQAAQMLRLRFADEMTAQRLANRLNVVEGTIYKWQRQAVEQLGELLWQLEMDACAGRQRQLASRLPPATYTQLYGVEDHLAALRTLLLTPGPPWLVAVESLGGMGKTALVDALCRSLINRGELADLAWVTAQQQHLTLGGHLQSTQRPALTPAELILALSQQLLAGDPDFSTLTQARKEERLALRLQAKPHLLVVDNLETAQDAQAILGHLRGWTNPTKCLITTRHSLLSQADIFHYVLPELEPKEALALLRHEAQLRNLPEMVAAEESALLSIYDLVGGNPLALRLVVGQLHVYPLPVVLADLRSAQSSAVTALYTHIYWQAWQALDEQSRQVLLAMPLVVPDGGDLDLLLSITGQPASQLRDSLSLLASRNLVDIRGGLHQRRYSIHSLTRSFLHQQVLRWG